MQFNMKRSSSGPWGKTRRSVATPEELMSALVRAHEKIPPDKEVTVDALAELARADIPASKETIKTMMGKLSDPQREKVGLRPKKPRYK